MVRKREARRERVGRRKPRVEDEEGWSSEDDTQEEKTDLAAARGISCYFSSVVI